MWLETKFSRLGILFLLLFACAPKARADIAVLLEEPYSYDGALAGTGHTAVYLDRVCAETPVVLRRCNPGEHGVVISRYTRIGGYDWIAIPLVPYLYGVENPDDVPLYADSKMVAFLRDEYRRAHLENIAPDAPGGEMPKGDWVQLIGSSYDRTSYGFQIETTPAQDDALIAWLNSQPNRASYKVVTRNCANFVRDMVNFYYPKAVSHGFVTDLEVTTPKHAAKSLVKYTERHPDVHLTRLVFPQVPGTSKRSKPVRGVLESIFRAKKYMVALAAFHPIIAGGVLSVYIFGDRFNPAKDAMVFNLNGDPETPMTKDERRTYLHNLKAVMSSGAEKEAEHREISWRQFQVKAQPLLDESGSPALLVTDGDENIDMGISRSDLGRGDAPVELEEELVAARVRQELGRSRSPRTSSDGLLEDWQLLEKINSKEREETSNLNAESLHAAPAGAKANPETADHGN